MVTTWQYQISASSVPLLLILTNHGGTHPACRRCWTVRRPTRRRRLVGTRATGRDLHGPVTTDAATDNGVHDVNGHTYVWCRDMHEWPSNHVCGEMFRAASERRCRNESVGGVGTRRRTRCARETSMSEGTSTFRPRNSRFHREAPVCVVSDLCRSWPSNHGRRTSCG